MRRQNILRTLSFIIFFSVGAASLGAAVLCDDLVRYYNNKRMLRLAEESLSQLESLNTDYEVLLRGLEDDPNFVERIAAATLGTQSTDSDTIYPKAAPKQLDAARRALTESSRQQFTEPAMPGWLIRCSEPPRRAILFLAGGFLILISFIWFGPVGHRDRQV